MKKKKIVIKIGTGLLKNNSGINKEVIKNLVKNINLFSEYKFVIVSSGAIGLGMKTLGLTARPNNLTDLQVCASIGQPILMDLYSKYFSKIKKITAQVLITQEGINNRQTYLNVKNTLNRLLEYNIIPVVNENDTVAVQEIKVGDNDTLSAMTANLIDASMLIILTNVDGLLDKDNNVITKVKKITSQIKKIAAGSNDKYSVGGMKTKIAAAQMLMKTGKKTIIANGNKKDILSKILNKDKKTLYTVFYPEKTIKAKTQWIYFYTKAKGRIIVDNGAVKALIKNNSSLLPSGIIDVEGKFSTGDIVEICSKKNKIIGKGLTNFSSNEVLLIKGKHSNEVKKIFSCPIAEEVIHKNNLIILRDDGGLFQTKRRKNEER